MTRETYNRIVDAISRATMGFNDRWLANGEGFYAEDIVGVIRGLSKRYRPTITSVMFNDPATIVWFSDGDKVVAVCDERDYFDKEKGVLHCIAKKFMGSTAIAEVSAEWEEE